MLPLSSHGFLVFVLSSGEGGSCSNDASCLAPGCVVTFCLVFLVVDLLTVCCRRRRVVSSVQQLFVPLRHVRAHCFLTALAIFFRYILQTSVGFPAFYSKVFIFCGVPFLWLCSRTRLSSTFFLPCVSSFLIFDFNISFSVCDNLKRSTSLG